MSRIGKNPVAIPSGVTVTVSGNTVKAKGKLGEVSVLLSNDVTVKVEGDKVKVSPARDTIQSRKMWGTGRALIAKMVKGVTEGYTRNLKLEGVGFKAAVQGKELVLNVGYSHDVKYPIPDGIKIATPKPTEITISGIDDQRVGQVAAEIRKVRLPEPYKGKGIMHTDERIRRKEGKKK